MIETHRLKDVVIFFQIILSKVASFHIESHIFLYEKSFCNFVTLAIGML